MNILHLTIIGAQSLEMGRSMPGDFGGGVAASLRDVSLYMEKHYGVKSIIGCCYDCEFLGWAKKYDLKTVIIPAKRVTVFGRVLLLQYSVESIRDVIKKERIDVIHAHYFSPAYGALKAAKSLGIPVFVTIHQGVSDYISDSSNFLRRFLSYIRRELKKRIAKKCFKAVEGVIAVSNYVKKSMVEEGFVERDIHVIHNGIDTMIYAPDFNNRSFKDECGYSESNIIVGSIGRLDRTKGYIEIIRAAKEIRQEAPDVRFVFIGEGPEKEEYIKLAKQIGVDDIISFCGFRGDVVNVLQNLDIFLMPTFHVEGFSIVLLEALASEVPVIATAIGGNGEVLDDGKTGVIIAPKDVDSIVSALLKVSKDLNFRKSMSKAGRELVERKFSLKIQVESLVNLYSDFV